MALMGCGLNTKTSFSIRSRTFPQIKSSSGAEDAPFFRGCGAAISRLHFNFDFVLKNDNKISFDYSFVVIYCSTTPICG